MVASDDGVSLLPVVLLVLEGPGLLGDLKLLEIEATESADPLHLDRLVLLRLNLGLLLRLVLSTEVAGLGSLDPLRLI